MTLFANTVVPGHRIKAWLCVISLYSVPTAFFVYQSRAIWHGEPNMQTSMSSSWGGLPSFFICAGEGGGFPHLYHKNGLSLRGLHPRTNPPQKIRVSRISSTSSALGRKLGNCLVINATALQPLGGMRKSSLTFDMYVAAEPDKKPAKHINLLSYDPHAMPRLQVLTGLVPGVTQVELRKIRKGSIGVYGDTIQDEAYDAVLQFLAPTLKNSYSTQLQYTFPDLEMEFWAGGKNQSQVQSALIKKLNIQSQAMRNRLQTVMQTPKQDYKFTIDVSSDHVLEEVGVASLPFQNPCYVL